MKAGATSIVGASIVWDVVDNLLGIALSMVKKIPPPLKLMWNSLFQVLLVSQVSVTQIILIFIESIITD